MKAIPQRPMLYYEVMTSENLMVCPICNGTGANPEYADLNLALYNAQLSWGRAYDELIFVECSKCYGEGHIDWIKSMTGIEFDQFKEFFIDLRWICLEFLFMALSKLPTDYGLNRYFDYCSYDYVIYGEEFDVDQSLINFNRYKSVVSKYINNKDRSMINDAICRGMILNGKGCTKCSIIVPDDILIERFKKTYNLIPAMPDYEVDYREFLPPDKDFPLFRLCDVCNNSMTQCEINELKKISFDENNPVKFSDNFMDKIYCSLFTETYI